jgi:hypothetical protein
MARAWLHPDPKDQDRHEQRRGRGEESMASTNVAMQVEKSFAETVGGSGDRRGRWRNLQRSRNWQKAKRSGFDVFFATGVSQSHSALGLEVF